MGLACHHVVGSNTFVNINRQMLLKTCCQHVDKLEKLSTLSTVNNCQQSTCCQHAACFVYFTSICTHISVQRVFIKLSSFTIWRTLVGWKTLSRLTSSSSIALTRNETLKRYVKGIEEDGRYVMAVDALEMGVWVASTKRAAALISWPLGSCSTLVSPSREALGMLTITWGRDGRIYSRGEQAQGFMLYGGAVLACDAAAQSWTWDRGWTRWIKLRTPEPIIISATNNCTLVCK